MINVRIGPETFYDVYRRKKSERQYQQKMVEGLLPRGRDCRRDEGVGVSRQLDGVPIQPHLVQIGLYVVAGAAFAECLVCNSRDLVVL
ncbi:hypothetical protein GOODEAATRI_010862 [Goodea atripinnis]|uniref:Uncharacterized protein n=1 Tax=Goodea atripinnis TaxID=208336 RepID=A0ABV0NTH9_9TELE